MKLQAEGIPGANWKFRPLGELFNVVGGGTPSKRLTAYYEGSIPWATIRDMHTDHLSSTEHTISAAGLENSSSKLIPAGEVIMASRVGLGKACILKHDTAINQDIRALIPMHDEMIERRFCLYWLQSISDRIVSAGSGATVQGIKLPFIKSLPFPLITRAEQKRIVAVLDQAFAALDRARAHAKANLADAQELFDNTLLATFDELLAAAAMMTLSDAADDFSRGKSRHRPRNDPKLYDGDYPFIQTGDIRRSERSIREYSQTYNEAGLAQSKLWPVGTVCITIAANIAETGVLEFEGCFPDSVIGMVPNPDLANAYYVEYMLRYFAKELKLRGKGSAQDNINLATFERAKFPFPPLEQQTAVVDELDSIATQVASLRSNYQRRLSDIANLRQSLLQKAFSGDLV